MDKLSRPFLSSLRSGSIWVGFTDYGECRWCDDRAEADVVVDFRDRLHIYRFCRHHYKRLIRRTAGFLRLPGFETVKVHHRVFQERKVVADKKKKAARFIKRMGEMDQYA